MSPFAGDRILPCLIATAGTREVAAERILNSDPDGRHAIYLSPTELNMSLPSESVATTPHAPALRWPVMFLSLIIFRGSHRGATRSGRRLGHLCRLLPGMATKLAALVTVSIPGQPCGWPLPSLAATWSAEKQFQSPAGHMAGCYFGLSWSCGLQSLFQSPAGHMAGCYVEHSRARSP